MLTPPRVFIWLQWNILETFLIYKTTFLTPGNWSMTVSRGSGIFSPKSEKSLKTWFAKNYISKRNNCRKIILLADDNWYKSNAWLKFQRTWPINRWLDRHYKMQILALTAQQISGIFFSESTWQNLIQITGEVPHTKTNLPKNLQHILPIKKIGLFLCRTPDFSWSGP